MRSYKIQATVKGEDDKTYGTEIEVEGPDSLAEFVTKDGESGVLEVLVANFRADQAATLRGRIAKKIGKTDKETGGRLANAVLVDLDG